MNSTHTAYLKLKDKFGIALLREGVELTNEKVLDHYFRAIRNPVEKTMKFIEKDIKNRGKKEEEDEEKE
ncbi:MAG: hypothetical protein AABY22_12890, partial [Nanoarchaeota archaeon]